jgi:hypothetical protein
MVKEAVVRQSFRVEQDPSGTYLVVHGAASPAARFMSFILCLPFFIVGFFALVFWQLALKQRPDSTDGPLLTFVVCVVAIIAILVLAFRKKDWRVTFTDEGLISKDTLYRYENISRVGSGNLLSDSSFEIGSPVHAAAHVGNNIYIQHGTQKVVLIDGMTADEAGPIYETFMALIHEYVDPHPSVS